MPTLDIVMLGFVVIAAIIGLGWLIKEMNS